MTTPDLITMLINLSTSLLQVIPFLNGVSYLLGLLFILIALDKLKRFAAHTPGQQSSEHGFTILAYFLTGAGLLFLPQSVTILANTAFGSSNVLAYSPPPRPTTGIDAMYILIQVAGFIWCIRGFTLLAEASQGKKTKGKNTAGPKGLGFIVGGIIAIHMQTLMGWLHAIVTHLSAWFQ